MQGPPNLNQKGLTIQSGRGDGILGSTSLLNTTSLTHYKNKYDTEATIQNARAGSMNGMFPKTSRAAVRNALHTITGESLQRAVMSTERLNLMGGAAQTMDNDWQQVLMDEKHRLKKKERENKSLINRLSTDLKREQDRNLTEVSLQAQLKRENIELKNKQKKLEQ